jgi:beta-glucosidase
VDVAFELTRRDLSVWNVEHQAWELQSGAFGVWAGASSRDLRARAEIVVE